MSSQTCQHSRNVHSTCRTLHISFPSGSWNHSKPPRLDTNKPTHCLVPINQHNKRPVPGTNSGTNCSGIIARHCQWIAPPQIPHTLYCCQQPQPWPCAHSDVLPTVWHSMLLHAHLLGQPIIADSGAQRLSNTVPGRNKHSHNFAHASHACGST